MFPEPINLSKMTCMVLLVVSYWLEKTAPFHRKKGLKGEDRQIGGLTNGYVGQLSQRSQFGSESLFN